MRGASEKRIEARIDTRNGGTDTGISVTHNGTFPSEGDSALIKIRL